MMEQTVILILMGIGVTSLVYAASHALARWYGDYQETYVQRTERDLYGMFSNLPPHRFLQWSIGCFLAVFLVTFSLVGNYESTVGFLISFGFSLLLGAGGSLLPRMALKRAGVLRLRKFDLQLLDALLSMSNSLKAGFSIIQAFEAVVQEGREPIAQEFDLLLRETRLGVKFETASENLLRRVASEDLQIVLIGIETARQTGGNLTEVFDRLAGVIRERMRIQGRIRSLTAQGRLQGWAVGLMPFFLGVAFYFIQPDMMNAFLFSPAGIMMLFVMLFFEAIGFFFIRKIVNIDV